MCKRNKLFAERSLEIAKIVFGVNTLPLFFKKLSEFINLLKLPVKYTDFKQITNVTDDNINWLIKHFSTINEGGKNGPRTQLARIVFNTIKK
jgi:hypothetical protein